MVNSRYNRNHIQQYRTIVIHIMYVENIISLGAALPVAKTFKNFTIEASHLFNDAIN